MVVGTLDFDVCWWEKGSIGIGHDDHYNYHPPATSGYESLGAVLSNKFQYLDMSLMCVLKFFILDGQLFLQDMSGDLPD